MISDAVAEAIRGIVPVENVHLQEELAGYTTFRVGGPAGCLVEPENTEQLLKLQKYLKTVEIPMFLLGNGSNLLVSDEGFPGVVIRIANRMNDIRIEGERIFAKSGATMAQVARAAMEQGLTGLEFASGIPGTIGGGVVMNAGAYGGEMKQVVESVTVIDQNGEILVLDNKTMEFGYRTSAIKERPFIVTEVTFVLQKGDKTKIKETMDDLAAKRREKQPLEFPSAGSTFKRPEGHFAGELIMNAGLRGYRIGGAQVSEKHCGFLINAGGATAADILELIRYVQQVVQEKYQVTLETEVLMLGDFSERR